MRVRTRVWRLLAVTGSWSILAACPQLLSDEFSRRATTGDDGAPDTGAYKPPHPPPDAGPSPDAGPPSPPPDRDGTDAGNPDASSPTPVDTLRAALAHRYDLAGAGLAVVDSVGDAEGFVWNAALAGQGFISLTGGDEYVSLPNGLLSSGNDKTIEAWLTWRGGLAGQHIFDFGVSDAGELNQGSGLSYLFLEAASEAGVMVVSYSTNGADDEVSLNGTVPFPIGILTHVAVVVDSGRDSLSLYLNGAPHAAMTLIERLGSINDVNMWIGRSQDSADPSLDADVTEIRIYDQPLGADQVALSYQLGPDSALTNSP